MNTATEDPNPEELCPLWSYITWKSLSHCLSKLSKMTGSPWLIEAGDMKWLPMPLLVREYSSDEQTGAAVYFDVAGDMPMSLMIVFHPRDTGIIARCFLGHSYPFLSHLNHLEELVLSELGNIVVNAFVGALANEMDSIMLPSVPRCVQGSRFALVEALQSTVKEPGRYSACKMPLRMESAGGSASSELLALFPASSLEKLEKIRPPDSLPADDRPA
ncbi:MAG: hypothetical protein ABIG11_02280 [bacterium]